MNIGTRSYYDNRAGDVSKMPGSGNSYLDELLRRRLDLVRKNSKGGTVVDLCCAEGRHLRSLADSFDLGIGVDFAESLLRLGREECADTDKFAFVCGDATAVPLAEGSATLVYSISSLYAIENIDRLLSEVARILRPGGRCVLDLGCRPALNQIVVRSYPKNPTNYPIRAGDIRPMLARHRLRLVARHCFQILPMWGDRPRWLRPLLHPVWRRIMMTRVGERMLDEVVSSLPVIRNVAFRHVVVAEKTG